jgi:hypothetical protein
MSKIPKDQEEKFSWGHGDVYFTSHGEGPTLAELVRRQEQQEAEEKTRTTGDADSFATRRVFGRPWRARTSKP